MVQSVNATPCSRMPFDFRDAGFSVDDTGWWYDHKTIRDEAEWCSWLQPTGKRKTSAVDWLRFSKNKKPVKTRLCEVCERLNFEVLLAFEIPFQSDDGLKYLRKVRLCRLVELKERLLSGCDLCRCLHEAMFGENADYLAIARQLLSPQLREAGVMTEAEDDSLSRDEELRIIERNLWLTLSKPPQGSYLLYNSKIPEDLLRLELCYNAIWDRSRRPPDDRFSMITMEDYGTKAIHQATSVSKKAISAWGKRSVGERVDYNRIRKWLSACKKAHIDHLPRDCPLAIHPSQFSGTSSLFLDVAKMQLVERSPFSTEYAALSYVWGKSRFFQTAQSTVHSLKQPKGVLRCFSQFPQVIKDAVEVCRKVGVGYLWVDAICIVQDSADMALQLDNMGFIYSKAAFTIVAAAGHDASVGLPGVSDSSLKRPQRAVRLDAELELVVTEPSNTIHLADTRWSTRAWTYQERRMSQNILAFRETEVLYLCRHGSMRETELQDAHSLAKHQSCDIESWKPHYPILGDNGLDFALYAHEVTQYTGRSITDSDDILNAFAGLLPILGRHFRAPVFLSGLPEAVLDLALLWHEQKVVGDYADWSGDIPENPSPRNSLPSWSWASRVGKVRYASKLHYGGVIPLCTWVPDKCSPPLSQKFTKHSVTLQSFDWTTWRLFTRWNDFSAGQGSEESDAGKFGQECHIGRRHCRPGECSHDAKPRNILLRELCLKADTARLKVRGSQEWREWEVRVYDDEDRHAGVAYFDGPSGIWHDRDILMVCISRATEAPDDHDAAWNMISNTFSGMPGQHSVNELFDAEFTSVSLDFDADQYRRDFCWSMYNVLMVDDNHERLGIAKVHVSAFDAVSTPGVEIVLR